MGQGVAWLGPFSLIRIIRELPCLNPDLEDFEEICRIMMRERVSAPKIVQNFTTPFTIICYITLIEKLS